MAPPLPIIFLRKETMNVKQQIVNFFTKRDMYNITDSLLNSITRTAQKRARNKKLPCNITRKFIRDLNMKQDGRCALTGISFHDAKKDEIRRPFIPSIDRIDRTKGYTKDNVRLVCNAVNMALFTWGDDVFNYVALHRILQMINEDPKLIFRIIQEHIDNLHPYDQLRLVVPPNEVPYYIMNKIPKGLTESSEKHTLIQELKKYGFWDNPVFGQGRQSVYYQRGENGQKIHSTENKHLKSKEWVYPKKQ